MIKFVWFPSLMNLTLDSEFFFKKMKIDLDIEIQKSNFLTNDVLCCRRSFVFENERYLEKARQRHIQPNLGLIILIFQIL